jgi:hypothetical protein
VACRSYRRRSVEFQSLDGLTREVGDEFEVLVEVEEGELHELGSCRDQEIGYRRGPMLCSLCEGGLHLDGGLGCGMQSGEHRVVDQPGRDQATLMTSGSSRSAARSARRAK